MTDPAGEPYEVVGIGGSWFGYAGNHEWAWQRDFFDVGSAAATVMRMVTDGNVTPTLQQRFETGRVGTARALLPRRPARADLAGRMTALPPPAQLLIDGKLRDAAASFPIVNPATEEVIGAAPDASADDVDAALAAARRAFDETDWSTDVAFRVRCLRQLHQALVDNAPALRALTTAEAGAPAALTLGPQYDLPVESLAWTADLAERYEWTQSLGRAEPMGMPTATHGAPRGRRRRRGDHPVELPEPDQPRQGRARAGRRQHRRAQAGTGHPVGGGRTRPAGGRVHRPATRRAQRDHLVGARARAQHCRATRASTSSRSPGRPRPAAR